MKILLLGANGQLGQTFFQHGGLAERGELILATRDGQLNHGGHAEVADLASPRLLPALMDRVQPDIIVNTAAYTAVDRAEQETELAHRVNGEAVGVIGAWAAAHGALVIHYSTDYVFDGSQSQPYAVNSPTRPLGAYGHSKLAGERALQESSADHLTFRTAWVYAAHGHNFLCTMLRLSAERDELQVVADQHGAPTSTRLIVDGTIAALDRWSSSDRATQVKLRGIHHLVASGGTTWHGFATSIFELAVAQGLIPRAPRVAAISSAEFPTPARRPEWSLLDNSGFTKCFGLRPPAWKQALKDVVAQIHQASINHPGKI